MTDDQADSERTRKLDWLIDRAEIEDVVASYARGIDRCDPAVLREVYHAGARDEHGIFSGTADEFVAFIIPNTVANYRTMQHHFSTVSIDMMGDQASVESYFLCVMLANDGSLEFYGGRCVDRFAKIDRRWAIAHRQVVMDWSERRGSVDLPAIDPMFAKGGYGADDPSYQLLPQLRLGGFFRRRHPAAS